MTAYRNPWHRGNVNDGPAFYTTDKPGLAHAGCMIYHVLPAQWDVVKAGTCIAQRAGLSGAKECAEIVEDLAEPTYEDVRRRLAEKEVSYARAR